MDNCIDELSIILPQAEISTLETPGGFEIPVTVEYAFENYHPDVVIAFGVIIKGATDHADLIAASITNSLQDSAVRRVKPVIHEVLLVNDEEQAYARCIGSDLNRGREAARAAHKMHQLFSDNSIASSSRKAPF